MLLNYMHPTSYFSYPFNDLQAVSGGMQQQLPSVPLFSTTAAMDIEAHATTAAFDFAATAPPSDEFMLPEFPGSGQPNPECLPLAPTPAAAPTPAPAPPVTAPAAASQIALVRGEGEGGGVVPEPMQVHGAGAEHELPAPRGEAEERAEGRAEAKGGAEAKEGAEGRAEKGEGAGGVPVAQQVGGSAAVVDATTAADIGPHAASPHSLPQDPVQGTAPEKTPSPSPQASHLSPGMSGGRRLHSSVASPHSRGGGRATPPHLSLSAALGEQCLLWLQSEGITRRSH